MSSTEAASEAVLKEAAGKQSVPSTSEEERKMAAEKVVKNLFDTKNFEPVYETDEEEFEDFSEGDQEENPELFLTDEDLDKIFAEMTEAEKRHYLELKEFHLATYFQRGRIIPLNQVIKNIMDTAVPGIPSSTKEQQEELRQKLLLEARTKREMIERGVIPEMKPTKRIKTEYLGPAFTEETAADGTVTITLLPGKDPYKQLEAEEDEVIMITGAESASEEEPDVESADDLSVISMESLEAINKDKVREAWKELSEAKYKEAEAYNKLSNMVEDMAPAVIQETIKKTPKPGSNIPQVVEELYEEIGDGSKFKKIVAAGFMSYEKYLQSKDPKYKPLSFRKIAKKFSVDIKGLMEVRKGEAYQREKTKTERAVKYEQLDVKPVFKPEPVSEGTEYVTSQEMLEGKEKGGEVHHSERDEQLIEEAQYEADLGDVEEEDPSGTSWNQPGYSQGGTKRKCEEQP